MEGSNGNSRTIRLALLMSVACICFSLNGGCTYFENRLKDFYDIVDIKIGIGIGLGCKVQVTDYFTPALQISGSYFGFEKHGRRMDRPSDSYHFLIFGLDSDFNGYLLGCMIGPSQSWKDIPPKDRMRIGAEVSIPGITVGIYLNLYHLLDFILGFFGIDINEDDNLSIHRPRQRARP